MHCLIFFSDENSSTKVYSRGVEHSGTSSFEPDRKDSRYSTAIPIQGEIIITTLENNSGPSILLLIAATGWLIANFLYTCTVFKF